MDKKELIRNLNKLRKGNDVEHSHGEADRLLIEYINDEDIKKAYEKIQKYYG